MYATNTLFCVLSCNQLILRHQMGRRIQKVKAHLNSIVADGNQLNVLGAALSHKEADSSIRSQGKQLKRSSLPPSYSKPVGIQSKIESMVNLLENPNFQLLQWLECGEWAKPIFFSMSRIVDNSRKESYENSTWLSVSQFHSVSQLQRDLASYLEKD
ncbi:hypothetical protein SUGI_1118320 [Cryptomeria japonica]|nr:hypothetical protein SUGI_1118320 [Cryptomeria japonica]